MDRTCGTALRPRWSRLLVPAPACAETAAAGAQRARSRSNMWSRGIRSIAYYIDPDDPAQAEEYNDNVKTYKRYTRHHGSG